MSRILRLHQQFSKYPFGNQIFSRFVARMAPYFQTIKPQILEIRKNYIRVEMKKRRSVENHLKTVHAIAMCNLCEFAAGICTEASIDSTMRWIPTGMQVSYLKKAQTDLIAVCDLGQPDWQNISELVCHVSVMDKTGLEVVAADITMKVSEKPKR